MTIRTALKTLLGLTLALPMLQSLLYWVAGLLASMGDHAAATAFQRLHIGVGVAWIICLIGLVIALALKAIGDLSDDAEDLHE
ncbi:hypothetical protein [Lacipirellula parvula]|jgi:hypothetical protein|uniref:Uncharacterized protein n=1 Tax=Lacipirellula parvula TaxID=2650471 RepID=A0A5K7XKB0_9BACT|nr:hypothetical protein [Lacipirellula parvula]BBO34703.1 hypothetical protein PLANPX_4315 [Lacipirellula parvula]